jgi:cytochrome c-type biogenesis protein CcmE
MTSTHKKAIAAGLILAAAGGYLLYAGVKAGQSYYLSVDEFLADKSFQVHKVRLRGAVAKEGLVLRPGGGEVSFRLLGDKSDLRVFFQGAVPDTFAADREVVVEGVLDKDGVFQAKQLLTKCASKYEGDNARAGRKP